MHQSLKHAGDKNSYIYIFSNLTKLRISNTTFRSKANFLIMMEYKYNIRKYIDIILCMLYKDNILYDIFFQIRKCIKY